MFGNSKANPFMLVSASTSRIVTSNALSGLSMPPATEMALHVLAYNLTRVMNIMGIQPLMAAIRA
jgi:hypothetical protein